jgi:hypothetical protein
LCEAPDENPDCHGSGGIAEDAAEEIGHGDPTDIEEDGRHPRRREYTERIQDALKKGGDGHEGEKGKHDLSQEGHLVMMVGIEKSDDPGRAGHADGHDDADEENEDGEDGR